MCTTFYFWILYQVIYLSGTHISIVHPEPALRNKNLSSTERPKDLSLMPWECRPLVTEFYVNLSFPSFPQL